MDFYLRPVDEVALSFTQNMLVLLRKIQRENEIGPQVEGTRLFSLDVVAMYPLIPTEDTGVGGGKV